MTTAQQTDDDLTYVMRGFAWALGLRQRAEVDPLRRPLRHPDDPQASDSLNY